MRVRIFEVVQYENNPNTGESFNFTEENIISALAHKTIKQWAYGKHDEDTYTTGDEKRFLAAKKAEYEKSEAEETFGDWLSACVPSGNYRKAGTNKPIHWHIVCKSDTAIEISTIASWFGVPESCVHVPSEEKGSKTKLRGVGAFYDMVSYICHNTPSCIVEGKHRYPDSIVKSNFDWKSDVDAYHEKHERLQKYFVTKYDVYEIVNAVCYNGMLLKDAKEQLTFAVYQKHSAAFQAARAEYLYKHARMPATRKTFYITANKAQGGEGKSLCTHAIARQFAKSYAKTDAELETIMTGSFKNGDLSDWIYETGDAKVAWQNYDGQPIIIFNDVKAGDLLNLTGGRRNLKLLLDEFAEKHMMNIKYGQTCVVAEYILINGIQDFDTFKDLLSRKKCKDLDETDETEEQARIQFDRRFLSQILLDTKEIDDVQMQIFINRGWFDTSANVDYRRMEELCKMRISFKQLIQKTKGKSLDTNEALLFQPLIEKVKFLDNLNSDENKESEFSKPLFEVLPTDAEINAPKIEELQQMKANMITAIQELQGKIRDLERQYPEKIGYTYCLDTPDMTLSFDELKKMYDRDKDLLQFIRDTLDGKIIEELPDF
jgi:hypothetical protein